MSLPLKSLALAVLCAVLASACASPSTQEGYLASVEVAEPDLSTVPDGLYAGSKSVGVPFGSIAVFPWAEVELRIEGHRYASLRLIAPRALAEDPKIADFAAQVVAEQSLRVDAASGCTFTIRAVQLAAAQALPR